MARKGTKSGDNYDAAERAQIIRGALDGLKDVAVRKGKAMKKYDDERDVHTGLLKGLGFKQADLAQTKRIHELAAAIEAAETDEEKAKAKARYDACIGTMIETIAAVQDMEGGDGPSQLNFHTMLENAAKARAQAKEDETAPAIKKGGDKKKPH